MRSKPMKTTTELSVMAKKYRAAVFDSHRIGGPVDIPLENRQNPLSMLK